MTALLAIVLFCTPASAVTPAPQPPSKAPRFLPPTVAYADVELRWEKGVVSVRAIKPGRFAKPTSLQRWRGRFVASALKGPKTLVELEFDFPLLADAESPADTTEEAHKLSERLKRGVISSTIVRVPLPEGADAISVWDSATRKTVTAPLPKPAP